MASSIALPAPGYQTNFFKRAAQLLPGLLLLAVLVSSLCTLPRLSPHAS